MSFDRQAARALFNNAPTTPSTRDRTSRRTLQSAPGPNTARAATASAAALDTGLVGENDLYARLSRTPKRSKASVVLPVLIGVGLLAGVAVIFMAQSNKGPDAADIAAPSAPSAVTTTTTSPAPTPAPVAATTPALPPLTATAPPPPAPVARAAPARATATVRPSRPAARPAPRASTPTTSATAPTAVNPPAATTAPSEPAPIVLPPPLPTPEPTAPQ